MLTVRLTVAGERIGLLEIVRRTPPDEPATYDYTLWQERGNRLVKGRIEGFDRDRGCWALVEEVLAASNEKGSAPKDAPPV